MLGFAIERASALNGFWNLYIAVATGLVGIMASGKPFTQSKALKLFLSFAFVVFAVSEITIFVLAGLRPGAMASSNSLLYRGDDGVDTLRLNLR